MPSVPLPEPGKHRDPSSTCPCGTVPDKEKQDFPRPVNVGRWGVRWPLSEILRWVADRQRERDASSDS